ncbi:MAG: adenylate/guanylate cyclase domain-containing protein [Acidimicrobiales bacterium]|nr:adenylate/guanylate cyclase domain-containing protein [Acidimicrobiales bacterium]
MNCTSCGEENRPNAKFCGECGTPITRACATCGHNLHPTAKFCDECGSATTAAAEGPPPSEDRAVRRTVTIVFADLVGSTAFGERVDAETARREMGAYHELARDVIESHDGEVIKFQGDGVMAGFGVHDVSEDDADRAVRAGLELQRRFAAVIDGIRDRHSVEVGLRVGVNTGEVVIAEDDADMVGDPINTAARIEAQCTPGRVLVGEQTWRLTRSTVDYEVLGEVEVKGKAEPIATFQVLAAVEDEEVATPFVGREAELAALTAALENTIAEGAPQLVTVIGSPGVGKTRLAAELARRASEVTSFDLRVDRAGAATFDPVADLLRAVSELPAGLSNEAISEHLRAFVGEVDDADRLVPLLAGFVGAAPMRSTEESFWAARRLVELVVATRPAVIVVDDIQWAEPLFLDLLEHLVEWTEGAAFVVALARPEIRDIRPAFAEVGRRVTEVIALEGLDPTTMAELATGILGGKALPDELIARLPDSTEGNPLFVRELVRMLVDDEVIAETPSGWVLAIDADAVEVPPTIISLLASRVERMDDEERRVVEAASVVGSEFARGAVGTLLPNLGAAQLERILERLRRQEIVDATGSYWGDEPVWRFHHVLIRDAAYRRLLKERRIDMHRRVGQWTETTAAELGGEHEISIAFHYEQAHGYLRELGGDDGDAVDLGGRAADLLALAAERALARDDLASAGSLATRALGVLDESDPRRPELLLSTCEAWFGAGRVRDGAPHLDELRRHTGDDRIAAWTAAFEGQHVVLTEPDRLNEVEPIVADAAARLADVGDDAGVAKARLVRALILARTGRVGECEDELDAALAAARAADDRRRITAVLGAAPVAALWGPSPVARAGGRCLDIIRLLRITSASPMVEAVSIRCQAVLEAMRGRFDEARTLIDRSQAIVEELGLRHGILECRMFAGYIELLAGDPVAAEPHLRVAHAGLGTLGVGADAGQAAALLSRSLLAQGRTDEAAELADESADLAGQNLQTGIASRTAQAELAAHEGDLDTALRLADEAVAIGADTDLTMDHATALVGLADIHRLRGDEKEADHATSTANRLFAEKGAVVVVEAPSRTRFDLRSSSIDTLATRHGRAAAGALYGRRDVAAWEAMCLPDARFIDRRPLHDDMTGLAERRALQHDIVAGLRSYDTELVATRGEYLALFATTLRFGGDRSEISTLDVLEVDHEGLLVASVVFEEHEIQAASGELTERYAIGEAADYAEVLRTAWRQFEWMADTGEFAGEWVADDYVLVDNRRLLEATADRDDMAELAADVDLRTLFARTIEAINEHGLVVTFRSRSHDDAALAAEWDLIALHLIRDGKYARTEFFDGDGLDDALRRFEQLTVPATMENAATRLAREFWSALYDDLDVDAAVALVSGGTSDERGLSFPDFQSHMADYLELLLEGVTHVDHRMTPLAIRGDLHSINHIWSRFHPGDTESADYMVARVSDGRFVDSSIFDDLDEAYAELERQYREHEGAEFADVLDAISAQCRAIAELDVDATWDLAHRDCMVIDHRPLIRHETPLADMLDAQVETGMHGRMIVERFARLTEHGAVQIDHSDFRDKDGIPVEFRSCQLRIIRDGKCAHFEVFPEHAVEAACARFDELTATRPVSNRAFEVNKEFFRRILDDRDVDGARALRHPDWVNADERGLRLTELDATSAIQWFSVGGQPKRWSATAVAVRGDRVTLSEMTVEAAHERRFLVVSEIDESGLAIRDAHFEAGDLRPALDLLNRWYIEGEGAPYQEMIETGTDLAAAGQLPKEERIARLTEILHDDFTLVDHRAFSFPDIDRSALLELDDAEETRTSISPAFLRLAPNALLTISEEHTANTTGGEVFHRHLVVQAQRGGRVTDLEFFAEDQLAEAEARFEELVRADRRLRNLATAAADGFYARLARRELDGALAMLGPGWSMRDNRDLALAVLDRVTAESWFAQAIAEGARRWTTETIAIRGRSLAAMRIGAVGADAEWAYLLVIEADDGGHSRRAEIFDPDELRPALDLLNEWYLEGEGSEHRAVFELAWALGRTQESDSTEQAAALATLMHDDVQMKDHRRFSFPTIDRAALEDDRRDVLFAPFAVIVPEYLAFNDRGLLIVQENRETTDTGGQVIHRQLTLLVARDGKAARIEWYDDDDRDTALARFDELTAPAPANAASRQLSSFWQAAYGERDLDAAFAMLRDDFVSTDRRRLVSSPTLDKPEVRDYLELFINSTNRSIDHEFEVIATRDDHLVLARVDPRDGRSGFGQEMLQLGEFGADGRAVRATSYSPEDRDRALRDLEALGGLGPLENPASRLARSFYESVFDRGDMEPALTLVADDFAGEDRRPLIDVRLGKADLSANFAAIVDDATSWDWRLETIAIAGDRLALYRLSPAEQASSFSSPHLQVIETDGSRIIGGVSFEPDDFEAAAAEMHRRYRDGEGAEFATTLDRGWELLRQFDGPVSNRAALTDDFTYVDHRSMGFGTLDRDGYLELLTVGREMAGHRRALTRRIIAIDHDIVLREALIETDGLSWPALVIVVQRDGRICRQESFDVIDLDAALSRFEELTAPADGQPLDGQPYRNRCQQIVDRCNDLLRAGDFDGVEKLYRPDSSSFFAFDQLTLDREGLMESLKVSHDGSEFGTVELETEWLRSRGEHLALARQTYVIEASSMNAIRHVVREIDAEGRIVRGYTTDEDGLDDAVATLDEWWLESLDPDQARTLATTESFGPAITHMPRLTHAGAVVRVSARSADGTDEDGAIAMFVDGGRVSATDRFPGEELARAVARFDELTAEPPTTVNLVIQAFGEDTGSLASGGFDPREAYSDAVIVDHRPGVVPLTSIDGLARSVAAFDEHDMDFRYEVVAWRGELVGLLRMTRSTASGMRSVWFNLIQADHDGRPARVEFFGEDHLDEALRRLDELWWENENPGIRPFGELLRSLGDRVDAGDWDGVRELLHPQFRHVVRKQLESEEYDTEGFVASTKIWKEMAGSAISVNREVVRHDDTSFLLRQDLNATDEAGMETQWSALVIGIGENGLVKWWEELEADDLDAAVARYEELTGTLGPASTP